MGTASRPRQAAEAGGVITAMAVVIALALGGCAAATRSSPAVELLEAPLTGAQQVPPVTSPGHGHAQLSVDEGRNVIRWRITYDGLSGPLTAARLHGPGAPGQHGPVAIPFAGPLRSPLAGEVQVTPEQVVQLLSGQWYVSLATQLHPQGELRGQLRPQR